MINEIAYKKLIEEISASDITLVAVSKTKPEQDIIQLYDLGQRDFGENYVQEITTKAEQLPKDIHWHFIGHLQRNKVKYIAPFVYLIHGVDSLKLLEEINKEAGKNDRVIDCLLQVHIAMEETKFGFDEQELETAINTVAKNKQSGQMKNVRICGLMGMASFTDNLDKVRAEFKLLKKIFDRIKVTHPDIHILSMGMSSDYKIAIEEGSTMVRIGSLLFGERVYNK